MQNPAVRLLHWLQHRWHAEQWLVDREHITTSFASGWRKRVLLSRSLCLYNGLDLSHVPATRRTAALSQQIKLLSPFAEPGFYAQWQGAKVRLWLWDQQALIARLPEAEHCLVLPDSALSPLSASADLTDTELANTDAAHEDGQGDKQNTSQALDGVYFLQGISGQEQQTWHKGELQDSSWVKSSAERLNDQDNVEAALASRWRDAALNSAGHVIVIDLNRPAPLQAADKRLFGHLTLSAVAGLLLMILLLQGGGAISLWQQHHSLEQQVSLQSEQNQLQQHAMRRALAARELWLARQQILQQPGQLGYVQQLAKVLPAAATFWQRYSYEPGRLQLLLIDPKPDPRDYVRIVGSLPNTQNVQVQLDPANQRVTVQADLSAEPVLSNLGTGAPL